MKKKEIIDYNIYKSWKSKIILAPNGSGKTRLSRKLYKEEQLGQKVEFFTNERISDLVQANSNLIFVGLNAKEELRRKEILNLVKKSNFFKDFIIKYYKVTKSSDLKKISSCFNNLNSLDSEKYFVEYLLNVSVNNKYDLYIDEVVEKDKILKKELLDEIKDLKREFGNKLLIDSIVDISNLTFVTDEIKDSLFKIKTYIKDNNIKECLLCGKQDSELNKLIENKLNSLSSYEKASFYEKVEILYNRIPSELKINSCTSHVEKLSYLYSILDVAEDICDFIKYYLLSVKIDGYTLKSLAEEFNELSNIIENNKKENDVLQVFQNDIICEFNKLVFTPEMIELRFDGNILNILVDEKVEDIRNTLSESEVKRLCLAVLHAEIKASCISYVILDDPIDSYDDYYVKLASLYISKMICDFKNVSFTVFTHLYELFYVLAESDIDSKKYQFIIYYQNPSYRLNSKHNLLEHNVITKEEIIESNINEMCLLKKPADLNNESHAGINPIKTTDDLLFVYLSLINTIRSLIKDINRDIQGETYKNIEVAEYNNKSISKFFDIIMKSFLHYQNNDLISIKEFNVFVTALLGVNYNLEKYIKYNDINYASSIIKLRNEFLKHSYKNITVSNPIVKISLYKMLRIQRCKYYMEKIICKEAEIITGHESTFVKKIKRNPELGKKINFALGEYSLDKIFIEINDIYLKYRTIITDFSHGFTRMISPYLMTSMIDIATLENEISKYIDFE